jgi:hypothetical protein
MSDIKFTTSKGTKYILSFDQLDTPENIEVSFQTEEKGFETTNKGEIFEVMQIITEKVKQFLEKFKEKHPKKLNDFELYIDPISKESEDDLGLTEKNKRTQLYLRYIKKTLNPEEYTTENTDNIIAIYYNTPPDINYKIFQIGKSPQGSSYRIDYNKGSKNIDDIWIMYQDLDKNIIKYIKNYKNDIESLKQELINKGLKISNTFS